jgi:MYXO-CTERM domain-containing protein
MKSHIVRPIFAAVSSVAITIAALPERAEACGGLFCNTTPVVQVGEAIIFTVDRTSNTVQATINITYSGSAPDFAWVLPLQVEPTKIEVGAAQSFQVVQRLTAPRFQITEVERVGICGPEPEFALADSAGGPPAPNARGAEDGGVSVLQRSAVGPYDSVVLAGKDTDDVREWLVTNGYNVTDEMMQKVTPYLAQGNVLLALKLRKDNDVGDIQPIAVTMTRDPSRPVEACVPIKLTAIAAQDDMQVLAVVLSNEGRAIPFNYYHVTPNLARIDWLQGGANYNQVISAAVDEGTGNAFTTEFAGSSEIFRDQIWVEGRIDIPSLTAATRIDDFLNLVAQMGLLGRQELAGILGRNISDEAFQRAGVDRAQFAQCIACFIGRFGAETFNSSAAANEIRERIEEPEQRAQKMFDDYSYVTRMNTLISPDEMNIDPIFSFSTSFPDVSNVHTAKMILDCGVGGAPGSAGVKVVLQDGTTIAFDSNGNPDRSVLDSMPAAARVEQLAQGLVVRDNAGPIAQQLDDHNSRNGASGCGCTSGEGTGAAASGFGLLGLFGLAFLRRRRS